MAIAVIGGLIVSTVLSLVFVPAIFVLMDDAQVLLIRLFGRLLVGHDRKRAVARASEDGTGDAYPVAAE